MYLGIWENKRSYAKGDIVYNYANYQYFVCILSHVSDDITFPCTEDLYWIGLNSTFLNGFAKSGVDNRRKSFSDDYGRSVDKISSLQSRHTGKKRKIEDINRSLEKHKRKKEGSDVSNLKDKLTLLNIDMDTKLNLLEKYHATMNTSGSEYAKGMNWLHNACKIPFGKIKPMKVKRTDSPKKIKEFFTNVKKEIDKSIYGLEEAKQEILEYVARKIQNPKGKGHVLALCGSAGVGKTKLLKSLASALDMPFHQINCGGLTDVAVLTGHSETYVGSKPGKMIEALQASEYMNPIFYFDEIDKVSETKSREIFGALTHIFDEEQNCKFQDNYFSNIDIDLSHSLFVVSFNDISKVDTIVCDRMKVIYIDTPTLEEKVKICQEKMIPDIFQSMNFPSDLFVECSKEVIEYIITKKCDSETGVRQLRKTLEKIFNRFNFDLMTQSPSLTIDTGTFIITSSYVDKVLPQVEKDTSGFMHMYV